ncbi:MAG TPA: hypothetical protein PKH05_14445 [Nitrospira sp.]|uniref:hypothetical protein n=1 Tax=Accumulibacter sp. TaxID=2053492 RepID=UPI0028786BD9|nr:hypothetical protein [Accumulibacter sp.]HNI19809.1 hypothetical protein [Nitrospira sp.]MDS4015785.1 hypothetical protein [Accumulibacter sp.]MDS4054677.1 hypothetical protein [Accumulibacter sp.]HNK14986.1 hypothetical protein [Nitrospira sp.]HNL90274.1 hypothetical protein [Nitrospira sp.]
MHKPFGQIPWPNPVAASNVADAARHVESSLDDDPDPDVHPGSDRFPRPGLDIPSADDSQEVVDEVDPASLPVSQGQDEESHEGAAGGVVEGGVEYLAFYKSFRDVMRAPARKRWGIFFIKKRCFALATDMSFSTGESFADCLDALAAFLYTHELYHYRFDAHCLQMEATGGLPVYRPYRRLVAKRPINEWHEESIANFYGLKAVQPSPRFPYPQPVYDYLWDLVANSPGAYAGGIDKQQRSRKEHMVQQASAAFGNAGPTVWQDLVKSTIRTGMGLSKPRESTLSSYLHLDNCPVYWIDWVKGGKSVLVPYAASVAEINNDFIRRYLAGVQDHHSDHSYYRIDNGEKVKLPNPHRADLTNREFHNIIGKAGMTSPQFYKERDRTSVWRKGVPRSPVLPPRFPSKGGAS